jgi:hypothetical protein
MTETKISAAIRVDWWYGERVLEGEEELRAELAENYAVSIIHEQFCTESQYWNSKMYRQKRGGA